MARSGLRRAVLTGTPGLSVALDGFPLLHALAMLGGHPWLVRLLALISLAILVVLGAHTQDSSA